MNNFGVAVMVLMAACGGGGGGNEVDAPGGVDSPPPDMTGPPQKLGLVGVFEQTTSNQQLTGVVGKFTDGLGSIKPDRTEGPCNVHFLVGATGTQVSAGTITVTRGADVITLTPGSNNLYGHSDQGFIYQSGDALAIAATGDAVPAFSGDVTFPDAVTVTDPTGLPANLKAGFSVAWTGDGTVRVDIQQAGQVAITCDFATSPGAVPAAALSDLQQGDTVGIVIGARNITAKTAGAFSVELQALNNAFSAVGVVQ
jgi:hypothetical protein